MSEQEEPCDAQAYATNTNANPAMGMDTYNLTFHANGGTALNPNPTLLNPGGPAFTGYVGDVPWQYTPPPAPWQPVQIQFVPSNTFPTEQSLREFVEQRVEKYLDEKLDERVGKALDELADALRVKALQPGTWALEASKE